MALKKLPFILISLPDWNKKVINRTYFEELFIWKNSGSSHFYLSEGTEDSDENLVTIDIF